MRAKKFDGLRKKISAHNFKNKKINSALELIDDLVQAQNYYFNELKKKVDNIETMVGELEVNKRD